MASATACRLTMKFNFNQQIRGAGWSESYDLGYASLATASTNLTQIGAFILDRCFCLGIGPVLVEATLSGYVQPLAPGAPPVRRSTIEIPLPKAPAPGEAYNKALSPAPTSDGQPYAADFATQVYYISLQTSLTDIPIYRRNCWLAGIPDVSDETDSARVMNTPTQTALTKFMNDLCNGHLVGGIPSNGTKNGVSIKSIDRSGANPLKPCTAWNLNVNTYTVPAHGFQANQPIIAEGMKTAVGGKCPRGRYLVQAVIDVDTISLQGSSTPSAPLKTGAFRAAIYTFNTVQLATALGFTKRNKGRPFGLLVGRRRVALIKRT